MKDTGIKTATRVLFVIFLVAVSLTTAGAFAAEADLNTIPDPLRPEAARLIEKGIRKEDTIRLTHQFLELQSEQKTILSAYRVLMRAMDIGLPAEPVLNKAFEGTAKKIQPDLITAAMQKVLNRYETAYHNVEKMLNISKDRVQLLGNLAAESMAAGLKSESLIEIFTALQQRSKTMRDDSAHNLFDATLISARDMSRLGTSHQLVAGTLCAALQTGMDRDAMMRFRHDFMQRTRSGKPDDQASKLINEFQNRKQGQQSNMKGEPDIAGSSSKSEQSGQNSAGGGNPGGGDGSGGQGGSGDGAGGSGGGGGSGDSGGGSGGGSK